ncbi:hypothetical protein Kpho02_29570 [Kitasatospora phosalacinea]|uniref:Lipoprotein n=1 Tax=Kitasatospora phosalacinea TaxID=2065 RepID=A0A9W6Q952_9ACTN|nr:hypothetical protein [Kitasatospora phosalacinea]GLW70658.1 hypothetical protein Kpho02_29570 [Kitasatospora phosalacinea]
MGNRLSRAAAAALTVLLAAGCSWTDPDPAPAPSSTAPPRPTAATVHPERVVWWGGRSFGLQSLSVREETDGRTTYDLVLRVDTASPVKLAVPFPRIVLESGGLAVADSGTAGAGPLPSEPGVGTVHTVLRGSAPAGERPDLDALALVLTDPAAGSARAVLPVGDGGPEPVALAPVPLHASAATLDTGRFHWDVVSAQVRDDTTGSTALLLDNGVNVNHDSRVLRGLKQGQHTVQVLFDAPAGTIGEVLSWQLTLPDGRRIAPSVPVTLTTYPDRTDRVSLAAWFDFYGDTAGTYTLQAADGSAAPAVIALGTG